MSRRVNPKTPTQRELAKAIIANLGSYRSAIDSLAVILQEVRRHESDESIGYGQCVSAEELVVAARAYETALVAARREFGDGMRRG